MNNIYQKIYDFFGIRNCEYVFGEVFNNLITDKLRRDIPERYTGETDEHYRNRVLEHMKQKEDLK